MSQDKKNEILVIADNRPGTSSQAIGLAEETGWPYQVIKLEYGFFSILPNLFLSRSILRLTKKSRNEVSRLKSKPNIIISAGRRAAPIALYLKKKLGGDPKVVQIMNPNIDFKKFDLVILPEHDSAKNQSHPNLVTSIGALTRVDQKRLAEELKKFPELQKTNKTKIALLVGGSSKKTNFKIDSIKKLAVLASDFVNLKDAKLLVLNSRRTSAELTSNLKSELKCDFEFFDWKLVKDKNPYFAILGVADVFIITGDSVSMISECCSTGKPVFIFDDGEISSKKHRKFHRTLYKKKIALSFNAENFSFESDFVKLEETKRISNILINLRTEISPNPKPFR